MSLQDDINFLNSKLNSCISCCEKHEFNSIESRLNYCSGFLESDYPELAKMLDFLCIGHSDLPF